MAHTRGTHNCYLPIPSEIFPCNHFQFGAGYTTLFLFQALKDNNEEMQHVVDLDMEGRIRMLDYLFGTPRLKEWVFSPNPSSCCSILTIAASEGDRLQCSKNVARTLGLESYLQFLKG